MKLGLAQACTDPRLLGASITWRPKQLDVLRHFGDDALRLVVVAAGRQGGKTSMACAAAIWGATMRDDLDGVLPRGRTRYALIAAPSESQSRELIRVAAGMIEASAVLRDLARISADRIDFQLPSGAHTAIRALPANPRTVRGMSASMVIGDECAHFNREDQINNDSLMIEALEGSMSAFDAHGSSKMVLISTPRGESGRFFELFREARDGLIDRAVAIHAPAWVLNDDLDSEEWRESKRQLLGENGFLQEHAAEFVVGGGQFFDLRDVEFEDEPARPEDGRDWIAGFDSAFHADRFGVCVVGRSVREDGVLIVGAVDAIEPGGRLRSLERRRAREDRTLAKVMEVIGPYHPRIVTDQHQADAIRTYFGRSGYSVKVVHLTAPLTTAAFVSTRTRLVDGSLRAWRHPVLVEDMRRVRARDATEVIQLPRYAGGHCDCVSALALAVYEHRFVTDEPPVAYRPILGVASLRDNHISRELDGLAPGFRAGWVDPDGAGNQSLTAPWEGNSIFGERF